MQDPDSDLFRKEAVEHYLKRNQIEGDLLRISSWWTRWLYWALLIVFAIGMVYLLVGRMGEYAEGTAIVQYENSTTITAPQAGIVQSIEVGAGDRITSGRVLVRFHDAQELAELKQVEKQFELHLASRLRDPSDMSARQTLANLSAQREYLQSRLEERVIRAPKAGIVSDIRISPGQVLQQGDVVLSLVVDHTTFSIVAVLPGRFRPQVKAGMSLRLEIVGYQYAYQTVVIDRVSDEVIGALELRRSLPPELADTVRVTEPVFMIEARLPDRSFKADGKRFDYYYGMQAKALVQVKSQRIICALIPGLEYLFEDTHG